MSTPRNEPKNEADLAKLSELVKNNDLTEIRVLVSKAKQVNGWRWYFSDDRCVENAMRDAVLLGQKDTVKFFLDEGMSAKCMPYVNTNSRALRSLIGFAADSGNLEMVQLLVQRGADIKPYDSYFNKGDDTAIKAAVIAGHADIVDYLLANGASYNALCYGGTLGELHGGTSLLAKAAEDGNTRIIESLLKYGASIDSALQLAHEKFKYRYNQFSSNLKSKCDEFKIPYMRMVKNLLDYSMGLDLEAEKNIMFHKPYCGLTFLKEIDVSECNFIGVSVEGQPVTREMLSQAKIEGANAAIVTSHDLNNLKDQAHKSVLKTKLDAATKKFGILVNDTGVFNIVPLWRCAEVGDLQAVKARLNAGVNPKETIKEKTPLQVAIENGYFDIVKELVDNLKFSKEYLSEIIAVAKKHQRDTILDFLFDQIKLNAVDENGNTLLHTAVLNNDIQELKLLIKKGVDVNTKNYLGMSPLHLAAEKNNDIACIYLLANGAEINIQNNDKNTPLHLAAKQEGVQVIQFLIDRNADVNIKNNDSCTAFDCAVNVKKESIEKAMSNPYFYEGMRKRLEAYHNSILSCFAANNSSYDLALLKAMLDYYMDTILQYPEKIMPIVKRILTNGLTADEIKTWVSKEFTDTVLIFSLCEDLNTISKLSSANPKDFRLKEKTSYTHEEIKTLMYRSISKSVFETLSAQKSQATVDIKSETPSLSPLAQNSFLKRKADQMSNSNSNCNNPEASFPDSSEKKFKHK